jgi:inosine triphosphate pyrophosphatase
MAPKQLNFITGNKNKLAEVQAILAPTGVDLSNQSVDLLEIQGTIEEISKDKCRRAADTVCNMSTAERFTESLLSSISI